MGNYPGFWDILRAAEKKALRCDSVTRTAEFLDVARVIRGNVEVGEYFTEVVEAKFIKRKPRCLLDGLILADEESRTRIISYHLRHPFLAKKDDITKVLSKYRNVEKYRALLAPYFEE